MKNTVFPLLLLLTLAIACQQKPEPILEKEKVQLVTPAKKTEQKKEIADATTILAKKEVPILCYHQIKDFKATAGEMTKTYSVKPEAFKEQMKALADAGYQTILPDQLYDYLTFGKTLPAKPVMIIFDDTQEEQFSIGAAEMKKHNFKGVFFVMTVSINRPHYMSSEQIKTLSDNGHVIGAHTWDHHMVTKYSGEDWNIQLIKPKARLEKITAKPVTYFAYPFGLWNKEAIPEIKKSGYKMAFILSTKRDSIDPLYTVRRMIVSGTWSTQRMMNAMEKTFKLSSE